jgi:hypothetical protein
MYYVNYYTNCTDSYHNVYSVQEGNVIAKRYECKQEPMKNNEKENNNLANQTNGRMNKSESSSRKIMHTVFTLLLFKNFGNNNKRSVFSNLAKVSKEIMSMYWYK